MIGIAPWLAVVQPLRRTHRCACAASGHAAAPPRSVMNSRRRSGRDARFIARPPHRTVRAAFPHTACMGLSLSRVCASRPLFVLLLPSFVRPAPRAFFRPDRILPSPSRAATALLQRRRRLVLHQRAMIRGEPAIGHEQSRANQACIRLNPYRVPTMKQSYASAGKAPRRRVHSPSGIVAIAVCGLPPPRIVIGYRASKRSQVPNPVFVLSRSTLLLTPPAATRHRPVSHRS
jgi:hypothetical protein